MSRKRNPVIRDRVMTVESQKIHILPNTKISASLAGVGSFSFGELVSRKRNPVIRDRVMTEESQIHILPNTKVSASLTGAVSFSFDEHRSRKRNPVIRDLKQMSNLVLPTLRS